jgi:hypothetical protein
MAVTYRHFSEDVGTKDNPDYPERRNCAACNSREQQELA